MTLRTVPNLWLFAVVVVAVTTLAPVPAQSEDWPKGDGRSYLEMPDKMYNAFFHTLSWCRASVETPQERLEHLRGGFSEDEAQEILKQQRDECIRSAELKMKNARHYGYAGETEAVFDPVFWARLDEARENLK